VAQTESSEEYDADATPDMSLPASARAFVEDEDAEEGPDIEVADESWETAEETHEDPAGGSYAHQEPGAEKDVRVTAEISKMASGDMIEAQEGQTEESSEASAS